MSRSLLLVTLATLVAGCGSGNSPLDRTFGESRIARTVGPGGAVLRGSGGSDLEGFSLEIPEGAVQRLVEIVVEPGADVALPGSVAVSRTFVIRAQPDPGVLRRPAMLRVGVTQPLGVREADLFVATRLPSDRPSARSAGVDRVGVASDFGTYDAQSRVFTAEVRVLHDLQVRRATTPRLSEDAIRLAQLGYARLADLTDAGVAQADLMFGEAQRADPFAGFPNLLRAISRVVVALNGRADTGPGIDSVGEVLRRIGLDVDARSLVERVRTGAWPRTIDVPAGAPTAAEIVEALRTTLRPAIELALDDLDRVPPTTGLVVTLPAFVPSLPGSRELDASDVLILQALLEGGLFVIDHLADHDLDADFTVVAPATGPQPPLDALLARFPSFGSLLRAPDALTVDTLRSAMLHFREGYEAIAAEEDDPNDDLFVLPSSFDEARRDLWLDNIVAVQESLELDVERRVTFDNGSGSLALRIGGPWRAGALSPRALAPDLFRFVPLAGTLPDPTLGGLFPGATHAMATGLLRMADVHVAPQLQIVADADFGDWTPDADALDPADPAGDIGAGRLDGVDLRQVWFAQNDDELAFRIGLAHGSIGYRTERATVYGLEIRAVGDTSLGPAVTLEVHPLRDRIEVRVQRDGFSYVLHGAGAAIRGADLEVTVDRFGVFEPDEPVRDRAIRAFAETLDLSTAEVAADVTRPFLLRL